MSLLRHKLITAGVKNLREYGYPDCDSKNILTDKIYSAFFVSMLKDNKGVRKDIDETIDGILVDITPATPGEKQS